MTELEKWIGPRVQPFRLRLIPFDMRRCIPADQPTEEEQAAFDACIAANGTIQNFWKNAMRADWMLHMLRAKWDPLRTAPERELRRFAMRCVERLEWTGRQSISALIETVKRRTDGGATLEELSAAQDAVRGGVTAGGIQGLPRFNASAASALAAWHCADASPFEAALWAAEFAARHDAFLVVEHAAAEWTCPGGREAWRELWHTALFDAAHPEVFRDALKEPRRRQAELLRIVMPDPFVLPGPGVRGDVFVGPESDSGMSATYCLECGPIVPGSSPGVLFDVRGCVCARCGRSLRGGIN
jgi:hypothetical protein